MIQPTIDTLAILFENPYPYKGIQVIKWWWCDALFMAPPVLAKLGTTLNDQTYYQYNDQYFKECYDLLYNKDEKLFARDLNYVIKGDTTDRWEQMCNVFSGPCNGWVMGVWHGFWRNYRRIIRSDLSMNSYSGNGRTLCLSSKRMIMESQFALIRIPIRVGK
jgi:hypothetical protein